MSHKRTYPVFPRSERVVAGRARDLAHVKRACRRPGESSPDAPASGPITPSIHLPFSAVRALRRFTVRAQLPPALAPLQTLATNLRWSWHPPTQDLFATLDPEAWERGGPRSGAAARGDPHGQARRAGRRRRDRRDHPRARRRPRRVPRRAALVPGRARGRPDAARGDRLLLDGVRRLRGAAQLLGRPRRARGRPPQGVLGPRRCRSIGVGLLYRSGYFRQSLSLDGWQLETYPVLDPQGLPLQLLVDDAGRARCSVQRSSMPGGRGAAQGARLAGRGRPGAAAAARLRHRGERPRPARRHRPALRRRPGPAHPPGDPRRHRRGARRPRLLRDHRAPAARGVPHQRGPRGLPGPGAHPGAVRRARASTFDEALATVRAGTVFTTHTPVPAGIDRFPVDMVRHYFHRRTLLPGVPTDRVLALGAEDNPNMFNMAHMGLRLAQRANGVSKLHGAVSRGMFGGLWDGFDADEVPIGSVTNGVHGQHLGGARGRRAARASRDAPARRRRGADDASSGTCATPCARRLVERGAPPGAGGVAAARRVAAGAGLDRARLRPGRAHRRVRPARADLQAAHAHAARQGPAARPAAGPAAARAARRRGQVAPRRRRRQGADPADRPLRRRPGRAAPDRVPARLRHVDGPLPVLGLRRVAEQPAAARWRRAARRG